MVVRSGATFIPDDVDKQTLLKPAHKCAGVYGGNGFGALGELMRERPAGGSGSDTRVRDVIALISFSALRATLTA